MSVREDLIAAKALIDTPAKWDRNSGQEEPYLLHPHPYTVRSALIVATRAEPYAALYLAQELHPFIPHQFKRFGSFIESLSHYEADGSTTHADIMALFDRAIEAAE